MKALEETQLRIGKVPEGLALAGTAVVGTKPLRRPTGTHADLIRGSMLTYGPTRNAGQRLEDHR